jgi:membrane protease YdiL (CAAX protease family)
MLIRGLLLTALTKFYSVRNSIIISSMLFGLWHVKNIVYLSPHDMVIQALYAGLIIGPVLAYLAVKTRSIWFGVMLHYLNNILAPFSSIWLAWLLHKVLR